MSLPVIFECQDTSEKIDFYDNLGLYIKPVARLNITIQLPPVKVPGQNVSNAEIIDKIKKHSAPEEFVYLRVIKSTYEYIRCEGEIENKSSFKTLLSKLDGSTIKMDTYTDVLKVRAAESKISYPTRHDWDSFFKHSFDSLDELKPGERPDTLHLQDVPCRWFMDKKVASDVEMPSVNVIRQVFSIFGEIRQIDVPMLLLDSSFYRKSIVVDPSGSPTHCFEMFIQYKDYISFVKAMDTFRGMKLLYADPEGKQQAYTANIRVDFDRTRHLSDREIKKREIDKLKNIEMEKIKNAQLVKETEKEAKHREISNFRAMLEESMEQDIKSVINPDGKEPNSDNRSKEERRREREEARRQKRMAQKQQEEEKKLESKIALEERKILIAQRKLESMRLLEELFNRVKVIVQKEEQEKYMKELKEANTRREQEEADQENIKKMKLEKEEQELQEKVQHNIKLKEEAEAAANAEQPEEFELRKSPLKGDKNSPVRSPSGNIDPTSQLPRSLLLSQQQQQPQQSTTPRKAALYDEEDPVEEKLPEENLKLPVKKSDPVEENNQEMANSNEGDCDEVADEENCSDESKNQSMVDSDTSGEIKG